MSADYWNSTQRANWQFTRAQIAQHRAAVKVLEQSFSQQTTIHFSDPNTRIFIHSLCNKLGAKLNVRQVGIATAEVYIMRFLLKVSLKEINLYLLIATAIYLSCKIEECPLHIRTIVTEARNLWPEYIPHDPTKLAEFEFYLIEGLDINLIVHHPYKSMTTILNTLKATGELELSGNELQAIWSVINDSYATDLILLYPPHIIAITAIYITLVLQKDELKRQAILQPLLSLMSSSNINLSEVIESIQELITLYEQWEAYDEGLCKKLLESLLLG